MVNRIPFLCAGLARAYFVAICLVGEYVSNLSAGKAILLSGTSDAIVQEKAGTIEIYNHKVGDYQKRLSTL